MQLACAIAFDDVASVFAAASAPGDAACSDEEWDASVRQPAVALADTSMPTLAEWGVSVGACLRAPSDLSCSTQQ